VAEIVDARRRIEKLGAALDSLTATARAVFHMRYGDDMSLEEIGEATGKKPGAVAVQLHRARLRLYGLVYGNDASPAKETQP
jgi:RNA polymerase sigma factor (sigma-70 family)